MTRASIIINNFNYGRFLHQAIDSALAQTHPETEVIVVDDGSTDGSAEIVRSYGSKVVAVLKHNGGQATAINAGFARCSGEFVLFLDSDDLVLPTALETVAPIFEDRDIVKVQWRQIVTDTDGRPTGGFAPRKTPPSGDLRNEVIRSGPDQFAWPALSGNAWSRRYLEAVLPAPELYRRGVDNYLFQLAPLFGRIETLEDPQTLYRSHGEQISRTITFDQKLKRQIAYYEDYSQRAADHCRSLGVDVDLQTWRERSWWCRLDEAIQELDRVLPAGASFTLVDDDLWGMRRLGDRPVRPFTERDGRYWGAPATDAEAIERLADIRASGVRFLVFAWPSFWWLEHYRTLHSYLQDRLTCILDNPRIMVFETAA